MSFINKEKIDKIHQNFTTDISLLGKLYKAKKSELIEISVKNSNVEDYLKDGWEISKELKSKKKLTKAKSHLQKFKDDLWCQFYELGYRMLSATEFVELPFGKEDNSYKNVDLIVMDEDSFIVIDCKAEEKIKKAPSYEEDFQNLSLRLDGFRKVIWQAFGNEIKLKYVFATRNLRVKEEDISILNSHNCFYYSDNTYKYINNLLKSYKNVARYQFLGLLFKHQLINSNKIEIPAIEGNMGKRKYYMFSIEPELLLKMGFILHRSRVNEEEAPTYQRLLVPSRLTGITKFIDEGGYFPNSLIVNFNTKKHKLKFEPSSKISHSNSKNGILKVPNAFAIAYIIDGQHRLYGYANSRYKETNTIPVVAFDDLDVSEQLKIFFDINQNQKAVSPSLRLMLDEDLYWNAERADSRFKALRSSIIRELAESPTSPLFNKIESGADSAPLSAKYFSKALIDSGFLPKVRGNTYLEDSLNLSFYDIENLNHDSEMKKAKKKVIKIISLCFEYVESNYPEIYNRKQSLILSNRGAYAFIAVVGSLNKHLIYTNSISFDSSPKERFDKMSPFIDTLMAELKGLNREKEDELLSKYGSSADLKWLRGFQSLINKIHTEYEPEEVIIWKERQDKNLQEEGRKFTVEIEKYLKRTVLEKVKFLFDSNWELEINSIKRKCIERAEEEKERYYKEGLGSKEILWTDMFMINDYKSIIDKYWTRIPKNKTDDFESFQDVFSIDIGEGTGSKAKSIKWISKFNSLRNNLAHEGTKEKGLSKEEVKFLEGVYKIFY